MGTDLLQAAVANVLDSLAETIRERWGEGLKVLFEPAKWASDDNFVKLKDLFIGSFDPRHIILCRRLAVDLGYAGFVADICTLNGRLSDLLQDFAVCPCAKEVFWDWLARYVKKGTKRVCLTALDTLL